MKHLKGYNTGIIAFIVIAIFPLFFINQPYYLDIIFMALLFAALASSWNIIGGFGGQISFGHAIFFGVGAYTTAILFMNFNVSPWISMWLGALFGVFIAFIIGLTTFKLRGPFFSIATLVLNQLVLVLVLFFDGITGGSQGILIPFDPSVRNMMFENTIVNVYIIFGFLVFVVLISFFIVKNKLGFQLQAISEDQDASRILGVNPFWIKMKGFLISAALTSIGGSIYAMYLQYLEPDYIFSLAEVGALFALICMIGGIGTIPGPIIGALIIIPLDIFLRGNLGGGIPGLNIIIYSILLIFTAIFFKGGIIGTLRDNFIGFQQRKVTKLNK